MPLLKFIILISKIIHNIISQIKMYLARTGSESNFVTNWISFTLHTAKKLTWLTITVQLAENCDLS